MKTLLISYFVLATAIFLISCSSSSDSIVQEIDYFPLSIGNYWIYKTYDINQDSTAITGTEVKDSIAITGTREIQGQTAFIFQYSRQNDTGYVPIDTLYFYKDGKAVYQLLNEKNTKIPQLSDFWFKIAEFIDEYDNTYHTSLQNYYINFKDSSVASFADFILNSKYIYSERIPVLSSALPSRLFYLKNDRRFSFNYKFADTTITVNRTMLMRQKIWFGEYTGMAQIVNDPYYIKTAPENPDDYKYYQPDYQPVNGTKSELLRMSVK